MPKSKRKSSDLPPIDEEDGTINVVIETSRGARRARTLLDEAIERHAQE